MQSFIKDLILLGLIIILFIYRKEISSAFSKTNSLLILSLTVILSFSIQWYVLRYLPLVDCLPFKKGANILEKMKPPAGAIPDSTVIHFVYEKNHKTLEYTADKLPADLDSSYTFIKRYDKVIRKGNAEAEIKDFSLISESGNDSTKQILSRSGYQLMLISTKFSADKSELEQTVRPVIYYCPVKKYSGNPGQFQQAGSVSVSGSKCTCQKHTGFRM